MELAIDSFRQPELLNILIEDVRTGHEAAIRQIVYKLGEALRHHAGLSQTEGKAYSDHPFMERFIRCILNYYVLKEMRVLRQPHLLIVVSRNKTVLIL